MTNPDVRFHGKLQTMKLLNGDAKGLKHVLEERGFPDLHKLWAKCVPVCLIESENCCMARLLNQQDDFKNQPSMLETLPVIRGAGHECIFLPNLKFHCELNPFEMASFLLIIKFVIILIFFFQYWGWCKYWYREANKKTFQDAKMLPYYISIHAPPKLFVDSLIDLGVSWALTS